MKVGKTIKTVVAPKRQIRKLTKKQKKVDQPIPVNVPEKVESFKFIGHYGVYGVGVYRPVAYIANVTS